MYHNLAVLIDGVGAGKGSFAPAVAPTVEIDGVAAGVFAHKDTVAVVGAVK